MNATFSWQFFEPKAEQKVDLETDLSEVSIEEFRYTAQQLTEIKAQRDALIYAIASDDVLFLKFYLNDKYSQEFRTKLYHLNTAIGTGEVGRAVAAVGLGFAAMATAPILIGSNLARSLITDYIVGEVVDKISAAAGLPIGEILAFRDLKNIVSEGVENISKKGAKGVLPSFNKTNTPEIKAGKRPTEVEEVNENTNKTSDNNKNWGTYAPNRDLPQTKYGLPIPDEEAKDTWHTQLGKRKGRKDTYTKAREFNSNNIPKKDIEFTDHGRPNINSSVKK